ncbi:hypothetical protein [uncultured Nostoc sp.]|uniref:hypothetical protein n=1 Tax=uncultured Nostoc sp. TaxID=340711 RepID=UPI0026390E9C|nr:hypothetical protein [uncultured Nostoc sp.]
MKITAALVKEQGVRFAVVIVKNWLTNNLSERDDTAQAFQGYFPGYNIVLMSQDGQGRATFYGRPDIVRFLQRLPTHALPWKEFTFAN